MAARSSLSLALVLLLLVVAVVAVGGSVEWRQPQASFSPGDPRVRYVGRVEQIHTPLPLVAFDWSSTGLQFLVTNTSSVELVLVDCCNSYNVFVNGNWRMLLNTTDGSRERYTIASNLNPSLQYLIEMYKRTEAQNNDQLGAMLLSIELDAENSLLSLPFAPPTRRLEFFGDSITCGYGNLGNASCLGDAQWDLEDNSLTWAAFLGDYFDAQVHVVAWSGKGVVRNYQDPGITSPDPLPIYFNRTIGVHPAPIWDFAQYKPDAVVINLGTNDFSTQPNPPGPVFKQGYHDFIQQIRTAYGAALPIFLACGPMIGNPCCQYIQEVVLNETNVWYLDLTKINLQPSDYGCYGHPSVAGHKKMAAAAEPVIARILGW